MAKESKYGEKTKMVNYRVPESKVSEINQIVKLKLNEYEKDALMLSERKFSETPIESDVIKIEIPDMVIGADYVEEVPKWKQNLEKKSNSADIVYSETTAESYEGKKENKLLVDEVGQYAKPKPKFTPNATRNEVNMDALREIANGKGVKSELFTANKKPIDEQYDCIEVTRGIPDISERIYASAKSQIAFWDRDDNTVFYVSWENKYYRFVNSAEFNRFLKDNQIK